MRAHNSIDERAALLPMVLPLRSPTVRIGESSNVMYWTTKPFLLSRETEAIALNSKPCDQASTQEALLPVNTSNWPASTALKRWSVPRNN